MHSAYNIESWGGLVNRILPFVVDVNEKSQSGPEYPYLCLMLERRMFPDVHDFELTKMIEKAMGLISTQQLDENSHRVALMVTFLNAFPESPYSIRAFTGDLDRYAPTENGYKSYFED